jgi:hypothetical protein
MLEILCALGCGLDLNYRTLDCELSPWAVKVVTIVPKQLRGCCAGSCAAPSWMVCLGENCGLVG